MGTLPFQILDQFKSVLGDSFYSEMSVSDGYHILFKTARPLDVNRKWKLHEGSVLEVLCTDQDTVNIAPTIAYINKYEFSGYPEYGTSVALSDIQNIPLVDTETVRSFIISLEPFRQNSSFKNGKYDSASKENRAVENYMRQYGTLGAINRQIKSIFPNVIDLLDFLGIRHSNILKPLYINFFSLYADDGNNPDAILFYNNNNDPKNTWSGYSVQDFHSGDVMSFGQYLCKYDQNRFEKLMAKIGYNSQNRSIPINSESNNEPVIFKCEKYITEHQRIQILDEINNAVHNSHHKQPRIIITAPTGTGKTEMFYQLAKQEKVKMILALSYTSQVLQGKSNHTVPNILNGMCEKENKVPDKGSIFMTYDKSAIVEDEINPSEYIMIIDEAHNLVNHSNYRGKVLQDLRRLSNKCKAVIYMTATPEYLNYENVDLVIKIEYGNSPLNKAYVCKYKIDAKNVVTNVLINQHKPGQIDVVYARDIKQLEQIEKLLQQKSLETHVMYGDIKNQSSVYGNIVKTQVISGRDTLQNGGVVLTTNLINDGVNVLDKNIGNIYVLDPQSATDLIQFPSRFRNGYDNYFIFISGKIPPYANKKNRQELIQKYYNLALKQQESYRIFNSNICEKFISSGVVKEISLNNLFFYLDAEGQIYEDYILFDVQKAEARQMNYDLSAIENYMKDGYNFEVKEVSSDQLINMGLTDQDWEKALKDLLNEKKDVIKVLLTILVKQEYRFEGQILIKDYLKKKQNLFKSLPLRYSIRKHKYTGKYDNLLGNQECLNILYRYCTGLELNAVNHLELIRYKYSYNDIHSIKRTYHNLKLEMSRQNPKKDDKYYRFIELREWIRRMKQGTGSLIIKSEDLSAFTTYFNKKYSAVYREGDVKTVVADLNDIFAVTKRRTTKNGNKLSLYQVQGEWSLNNIRGLSFN